MHNTTRNNLTNENTLRMRFFGLAIAFAVMSLSLAAPILPISIPEPLGKGSNGAKRNPPICAAGAVNIVCPDWKREE